MLAVAAAPAVCYSGGGDGTLRAWELPELKPLRTFESKEGGHPVKAVVVVAGLVVSGSATGARVHGKRPSWLQEAKAGLAFRLWPRGLETFL